MDKLLEVKNLHATVGETPILSGFNLTVAAGETHALMGPNGSGKSTLAHILAGHPGYSITSGDVLFAGQDLLDMEPEARAAAGLFLAFQYPVSIPGVSIAHFLRQAKNAQEKTRGQAVTAFAPFLKELKAAMRQLQLPWAFAERAVNDGFSGGEKKRLEMLQMLILKPKLVILDEVDSGLDVDAMKLVAQAVLNYQKQNAETAVIAITHYQRLLSHLPADHVHIVQQGKIRQSGGPKLAHHIEKEGYGQSNLE